MTNQPAQVRPAGRRLIAVGVGRDESGSAALRWAVAEARRGDALHTVHAYPPLSLRGSSWSPVLQANDARRVDAGWIIARAVTAVRSTHPKIEVGGSAIEGAPLAALTDLFQLVDLVVVGGDDTPSPAAPATTFGRTLAGRSSCPVVIVPTTTDADEVSRAQVPVALLLGPPPTATAPGDG